jgi:benzoyl-CoA reductase/2-hydroxyglutaryl-CoA dehydratase subunit BcrC/BadD/HgdB
MKEEILEAATQLTNRYIKKWKQDGKKIIGYPCTFVPEEIIHAAGMLPFRLRGIGARSTTFADTYFGHVICSFPKCILELVGDQQYNFLDGAVVSDGCDAGRRLDECWRKAGEDHEGILPPYFFYFSVPHKVSDYSLKWFTHEVRRLITSMEDHLDTNITEKALSDAIAVYNKTRRLLNRLDAFRKSENVLISGTDAQAVILAGTAMPKEEFNILLEDILAGLEKDRQAGKEGVKGKRLLFAGSIADDINLFKIIENEGAVIVADNQCFGSRSYVDMAEEGVDPVEALAKRYLDRTFCPRMFGYYKDRLKFITDRAAEAKVDGVILQNIRFCDLHGADNGLFQRDLEKQGIPSIMIEREYGPLSEEGRIMMRVDAFLESIS